MVFNALVVLCFVCIISLVSCQHMTCYWTGWIDGDCISGMMERTKQCICNDEPSPAHQCPSGVSSSEVIDCRVNGTTQNAPVCNWKWGRWSTCTQPCGTQPSGETVRSKECWCNHIQLSNYEVDTKQCGPGYMTETAICNAFPCNGVKPKNKLYWLGKSVSSSTIPAWPIPEDTTFRCTRGPDPFKFTSRTWLQILSDDLDEENPKWHTLAKEYITARLNKAIGCFSSKEETLLIQDAQFLLTNCFNYSENETKFVNAARDKLARLNNGIGGLSNVDVQFGLARAPGGDGGAGGAESTSNAMMAVIVAVLVGLGLVSGLILYVVRRRRGAHVVIENETFQSSDEESQDRDDRSAEELRL